MGCTFCTSKIQVWSTINFEWWWCSQEVLWILLRVVVRHWDSSISFVLTDGRRPFGHENQDNRFAERNLWPSSSFGLSRWSKATLLATEAIELVKFTAWLSQRHLRKARNFFARLIYGVTRNLLTYWRRPKNAFGVFCQFYDLSLFLKLGL